MANTKSLTIHILDCTDTVYDGASAITQPVGGIENTIVHLSTALARRGHCVTVVNCCAASVQHGSVQWTNAADATERADIVIACNDPNLFDSHAKQTGTSDFQPILWCHNSLTFKRLLGKSRLAAMLRWRPHAVLLSEDQDKRASLFYPFRGRTVIGHGIDPAFYAMETASNSIPAPVALFISQPYRGLDAVIREWRAIIHPALPDARLNAFIGPASGMDETALRQSGIVIKPKLPRFELAREMAQARLLFCPGHPDETFCLAAAEATALGLPIVTRGIGSLKERVQHNVNGLITDSDAAMARGALDILRDDTLWLRLHKGALAMGRNHDWTAPAAEWDALFTRLAH